MALAHHPCADILTLQCDKSQQAAVLIDPLHIHLYPLAQHMRCQRRAGCLTVKLADLGGVYTLDTDFARLAPALRTHP